MASELVIHRSTPLTQFVPVPNAVARDMRLSFRARGVLAMLLSFPPRWRTSARLIAQAGLEGVAAVETALAELRRAGYLRTITRRDSDGRFRSHYEVFDAPQPVAAETVVRASAVAVPDTAAHTSPSADTRETAGGAVHQETGAGELCTGNRGAYKKTVNEDLQEDPPVHSHARAKRRATRHAHTKRARDVLSISEAITAVRETAAACYGSGTEDSISDGEALGIWAAYANRRGVRNLRRYLEKIFWDAGDLGTLMGKCTPICPACVKWEVECECSVF